MNNNGYSVLYRSSEDRPFTKCYWADNYYEAHQYEEIIARMFPELEVIVSNTND